jgi:tRNA modification GTPase
MIEQLDDLDLLLRKAIASSVRRRGLLRGCEIAIIGKPNAGKSSLLNALLGEARSIVSDLAGTTRDVVGEELRIGGHIVRILDTAGLRQSQNEIEAIGIEYAKNAAKKADIIIALFDGSQTIDESDEEVLRIIADRLSIAVINKSDLERKIDLSRFANFQTIDICAKEDVTPLLTALQILLDRQIGGEETTLVSERQIALVTSAEERLAEARMRLANDELELFSYCANEAIGAIGAITRPLAYDELLDTTFNEFCLGK